MSKVGGRKGIMRLINIYYETKQWEGEVVTQRYCMVKIPCAELGYT